MPGKKIRLYYEGAGMLITNFASGELSDNLFGRTDLAQYYNAAARLENFDVIPTGGVKRRSGTERLAQLKSDGRIIPFVVNRKNAFLLYLRPGVIEVYKLADGAISGKPQVFTANENLRLYERPDEIRGVQYAQNFDTMVFCHENYPPLEAKLAGGITIRTLPINFEITVAAGGKVTDVDKSRYEPEDAQYKKKRWLVSENNYPVTGAFFNGRLVFAGTKNDPQRVFASALKNPSDYWYNFSTYKRFLTEKKEYSVLFGQIDPNDTSVINAEPQHIVGSFIKPQNLYFVESKLYDPDTCIESINMKRVKLTRGVINPSGIVDVEGIKKDLNSKIDAFNRFEDDAPFVAVFLRKWTIMHANVSTRGYDGLVECRVKGCSVDIRYYGVEGGDSLFGSEWSNERGDRNAVWSSVVLSVPDDIIKIINNDTEDIAARIRGKIKEAVDLTDHGPDDSWYESLLMNGRIEKTDIQENCISQLFANVRAAMYYELRTELGIEKYYNFPLAILADVTARVENSDKTYIPFYTREIISDEYPTPDCGFTFEIASDMNDSIRWLAVNKGLVIGTETAEWVVPPGVHATNTQAELNSRFGSDSIQGTAIGDATVFFQAGKKGLVEYYIPQADNHFRANNMAMLSPQMLNESPAAEFDFVSAPFTKLFITREDGAAVTLLYERGSGTFAWGRVTTAGKITSAAALPGADGNDDVYLLAQRGSGWFLERLRELGNVYLDGYSPVSKDGWAAMKAEYSAGGLAPKISRVYRDGDGGVLYETLAGNAEPDWEKGGVFYIGYPYKSVLRTMPVLTNDKMKKQRIVALFFRFLESWEVKIKSLAGGREIQAGPLTNIRPPVTGIHKQAFPGTWDEEAQAELATDEAAPVKILALNAEMAAQGE